MLRQRATDYSGKDADITTPLSVLPSAAPPDLTASCRKNLQRLWFQSTPPRVHLLFTPTDDVMLADWLPERDVSWLDSSSHVQPYLPVREPPTKKKTEKFFGCKSAHREDLVSTYNIVEGQEFRYRSKAWLQQHEGAGETMCDGGISRLDGPRLEHACHIQREIYHLVA